MNNINKQIGTPALIGAAGAAAHFAVLIGLVELARLGPVAASGWGALAGLLIYTLLHFGPVLKSGQPQTQTVPKFVLIAGLGLGLNIALMALLANRMAIHYVLAQGLASGLVLLAWNFAAHQTMALQEDPETPLVRVAPYVFLKTRKRRLMLGPGFLALVLAIRLLTLWAYPLIDPSESRYAEMARKMVETDNWVTPQIDYGVPFWGKPPLAVWLNAFCLKVFGVNEFASRLSALLLCVGIVWIVYRLAALRGGSRGNAFIAPAMLAGMALFFTMAGSVATDQALSFGIVLSMAAFWWALHKDGPVNGYLFFIGLSIGLMSKGPVAVVLVGLPLGLWTLLRNEWASVWRRLPWIKGTALILVLSLPWYMLAEHRTPGFLEYFFIGEHWKRFTEPGWQGDLYGSGRGHPRGTIWVFWLLASMPWSPVFLAVVGLALWRKEAGKLLESTDGWRSYCLLWMLAPMLFFTVSANVIWTYILPGLPGCALLLAEWRRDGRLNWLSRDGVAAVIGALGPVLFLGAVIYWQFSPFQFVRTQKTLVNTYLNLRTDSRESLYFVWEVPFSAQFYNQGNSKLVGNVEAFQSLLEGTGRDFFVCPRRGWPDMPDAVKDRLQAIGIYHGYILLRHIPKPQQ